jgi:hypothetical protein
MKVINIFGVIEIEFVLFRYVFIRIGRLEFMKEWGQSQLFTDDDLKELKKEVH